MTLQEGLTYINFTSNKDQFGRTMTEDEYNILLSTHYLDFFKRQIEQYADKVTGQIQETELSIKLMREFRAIETSIAPTVGVIDLSSGGDLSESYAYFADLTGSVNGVIKEIELLTDDEKRNRQMNLLSSSPEYYPFCVIDGDNLQIYPTNITPVDMTYYRFPAKPIYDWYTDVNGNIQALAEGATHVWDTGEIDSDGVEHTIGDPDWSSKTIELEFNGDIHEDFFNELLRNFATRIQNERVVGYTNIKEQQEGQA